MYTFVSALLRKKGRNQRFETTNLTNIKVSTLFNDYRDGYIELSNTALSRNIYVQLTQLKQANNLVYADVAFPSWLAIQGNTTINGSVVKPALYTNQITYSDAIQAGCTLTRVHPADLQRKNTYPLDMMTDVYVYKTLADTSLIQDYVLTTVNGLCHVNIPANRGILVKGAGSSLDVEQDNLVGLISFENVGKIEQLMIQDNMIQPLKEGQSYKQAIYLDINQDLTNKSVMFSFCGRLFAVDGIIEKINDQGGLRINTYKLDVTQIILDSLGKLNLKSLEIDERLYRAKTLQIQDIIDDTSILAMLKLYQTFIVIVDTASLYAEKIALAHTRMAAIFETYKNTKLPYVDSRNMLHPYWKKIHTGAYTSVYRLHLKDTFYRSPVYRTGGYQAPAYWVNNTYQFTPRTEYETGHLLNIFYQTLVYDPDV